MDVDKQVEYWKISAEEDIVAAQSLLEKGHLRHSLFFTHLAIEKVLKGHVVRSTGKIPPKIHDLVRLAEMGNITVSKEQKDLLLEFGIYQLEGRYPDSQQLPFDQAFVKKELARAREIFEWLTAQLRA